MNLYFVQTQLCNVRTQQEVQFREVTVGVDRLYAIPSARVYHQGTYRCDIFSDSSSIVKFYYRVTVTPEVLEGYEELQRAFGMALLPQGQKPPRRGDAQLDVTLVRPPPPALLTACLTAMLLMLFVSLGSCGQVEREEDITAGDKWLSSLASTALVLVATRSLSGESDSDLA
ncbi:sperm acrosome membrane-associated protein 6 [Arapaima gigas]